MTGLILAPRLWARRMRARRRRRVVLRSLWRFSLVTSNCLRRLGLLSGTDSSNLDVVAKAMEAFVLEKVLWRGMFGPWRERLARQLPSFNYASGRCRRRGITLYASFSAPPVSKDSIGFSSLVWRPALSGRPCQDMGSNAQTCVATGRWYADLRIIQRDGLQPVFDDGRGKYPEPVNMLAPRSTRVSCDNPRRSKELASLLLRVGGQRSRRSHRGAIDKARRDFQRKAVWAMNSLKGAADGRDPGHGLSPPARYSNSTQAAAMLVRAVGAGDCAFLFSG